MCEIQVDGKGRVRNYMNRNEVACGGGGVNWLIVYYIALLILFLYIAKRSTVRYITLH